MKYLIAALILVMPFVVQANNYDCDEMAQLAEVVMEARQNGASMRSIMEIAGDNQLARVIVIEAYDRSRFTTEEYKRMAINDFSNDVYQICLNL